MFGNFSREAGEFLGSFGFGQPVDGFQVIGHHCAVFFDRGRIVACPFISARGTTPMITVFLSCLDRLRPATIKMIGTSRTIPCYAA